MWALEVCFSIIALEVGTVNYNIWFREVEGGKVSYTDEIEIQAGWLTPVIWLFAHVFYRHRQRRWKALLKQDPQ